ncbi:type I-E CRISPR-associated protein Cas6/Cse3/CasE [Microbacterium album]|uniref:Type I-E CRISPR-associated protein Cas6/Cse3/CasE n=1 Tax=Microbacterium album TaxID=2053191 RepID=A0A917IIJ8_9MICO|nr:type I-E CRISPR-associated protein Cas6/Cse3/CasE [Microbacterium album]GGH51531.1 type I-E CRISPR-associated protein Cas6/Cse3/CasE [Microbacterium album]
MYLSSFQFNPARRGAQRLLGSPHALHAAVLAGFPDPSPSATGRVLWRLDSIRHSATLYIVSPRRPDLTHLAEQAGWPSLEESWRSRSYQPLLDRVESGQRYRFRLTANPTHSARGERGERGKPYGHVTVAQQENWLLQREGRAGFRIDELPNGERDVVVTDRKMLTFRRRETSVTLRVASYEGTLTVADRDAFISALCFGVGRAKGYGCGLLTIAPVG